MAVHRNLSYILSEKVNKKLHNSKYNFVFKLSYTG